MHLPSPLILLLTAAAALASLPQVTRTGRYLYTPDGNRFYIRGVSYQQQGTVAANGVPGAFPEPTDYIDPLADAEGCNRDLPYIKALDANAIRVYSVNASLDHSSCMSAFSAANIYVILDLSLPVTGSINRDAPTWTTALLNTYIETIDAFLQFGNLLAVNVGNEVVNSIETTVSAPFIKAAARDIKAYLKSRNSGVLVGYASTDGSDTTDDWRDPLANYLACDSTSDSIDLYGLNNYRWCGASSFEAAYASTEAAFSNYPVAAYFSEYGCVTSPPRLWTEAQALYGSQMTPEWSGGLAFSYFPAVGGYGLVNISADNTTVTPSADYTRLQQQLTNITFIESPAASAAPATSPPACPAQNASFLASTALPPTPDAAKCSCFMNSTFSCTFNTVTPGYDAAAVTGDLLNYVCSALPTNWPGANCSTIAADGQNGTYGFLSDCDPSVQLSWAFSYYYELSNRNPAACDFSGNATANNAITPAQATAAANSCLASVPANGVFTPTASAGAPTASGTSGTSASGSASASGGSGGKSAAWRVEVGVLGGLAGVVAAGLAGAAVVLV